MRPLKLTMKGNIQIGNGYYNVVDDDNQSYYFPIMFTMITTKPDTI